MSRAGKRPGHLAHLHRLVTSSYKSLDEMFEDYVTTGCAMFEAPAGAVAKQEDAERGSFTGEVLRRRETLTGFPRYSFCIGTPILADGGVFGALAFWGESEGGCAPGPDDVKAIEVMAKAIGLALHQQGLGEQLAFQSRHDALTGLPNRLLLKERLDQAIERARSQDTQAAVVFIDLDRFKQINDTLGHSVGDEVLRQVALHLRDSLRESDTLARMGGDEFTAIVTGFDTASESLETIRRLLSAVRTPCRVEGRELHVTASIGVSFFPHDGTDADMLLRNADSAMYVAKGRGKDDLHCFLKDTSTAALEQLELENDLRYALERGELRILFQPQVTLTGDLAGLEVLLAWEHPVLGRVAPGQFVPIAEESGMILRIGSWVLREACRRAEVWQRAGSLRIPVAVNVSSLQFAQPDFTITVAHALREAGLRPEYLELELTESLVMRDAEESARRMAEIRALGVKISIDDFGTGYSSLSYLRKLPADSLKIDRSFLNEEEFGAGALALIHTIVVLAHTIGLTVTAEGIENEHHFELIRQAGCDRVQGHLFGTPLEPEAVEELLRHSHPKRGLVGPVGFEPTTNGL